MIQSIENYENHDAQQQNGTTTTASPPPSTELLQALQQLARAKTQKDLLVASRRLEQPDMMTMICQESKPIQERICKATALVGLLPLSLAVMDIMLQADHLPSHVSYMALCNSLKRAGRVQQLETLLRKLAKVAQARNGSLFVVALNVYLAALCESTSNNNYYSSKTTTTSIDSALQWLQPQRAKEVFAVQPDLQSFNTVMFAAAKAGNRTLVLELWDRLLQFSSSSSISDNPAATTFLEPDIRTYNARLRVSDSQERLQIYDEIENDPHVSPDRYTIDMLLVPLIRADRISDVHRLLTMLISKQSQDVVKDAFAAFLVTLVQNDQLVWARTLLDTYILVDGTDPHQQLTSSSGSTVQPDVRHFNILIDGYRKLAESLSTLR